MFFFSSRRRHTRWNCDWSSDVCSSDLKYLDSKFKLGLFPWEWEGIQSVLWRHIENEIEGPCFRLNDIYWEEFVPRRSEEHTSELQSQFHLVCRLLLEKKKKHTTPPPPA